MTSDTVNTLADYLATIDSDWRTTNGYTGRAVHRRAYWQNMAARILSDSAKTMAATKNTQPKSKTTCTR
jgi:hypothetical protein